MCDVYSDIFTDTTYKIWHIIRYVQLAINALNTDHELRIKLDNIWIDLVKSVNKVKNSDSEKSKKSCRINKGN